MPRGKKSGFSFAGQLSKMVDTLKEQRRTHADALASIDGIFAKIGITTHLAEPEPAKRGRKPGRPAGKRGPGRPPKNSSAAAQNSLGKKKFTTTGPDSILAFVKKAGTKGATGAEITKNWEAEGRGTGIYVVIGKLVNDKKLKKQKIAGGQGSRYTAA